MKTDAELLRCYLDEKSQPAFAELVQRYLGLVYSVAVRRVGGDAQRAEDVTQTVFNDLARKAGTLRHRASLGGWLYLGANAASAAVVRSERRRKAREIAAHEMQTTLSSTEPDPDWTQLRPVIDDAIVALKDADREAVVLRFFEKRSFAEVGAVLRVTEEAARKRVDRALDNLRVALERRGVKSTAGALGLTLAASAPASVPAGLGAKVAGQAFTTAGASSAGSFLSAIFGWGLPAAVVLMLGALAVVQRQTNQELRVDVSRLVSESAATASVKTQNRALAHKLAEVEALRTAAAAPLPALPQPAVASPLPARPIAASILVTAEGTIRWNNEFVNLAEFIQRLRQTKATADPESRIYVRGLGSYSAVTYVIDEARKAGIEHLTVESSAKPDDKFSFWWF